MGKKNRSVFNQIINENTYSQKQCNEILEDIENDQTENENDDDNHNQEEDDQHDDVQNDKNDEEDEDEDDDLNINGLSGTKRRRSIDIDQQKDDQHQPPK